MIILSVKESNNKLNYSFTSEEHEGAIFNILVEYKIVYEGDESYFTCTFEELEHTKNNKKELIEDSKAVCEMFVNAIATDLYNKIVKGELRVNS